MKKIFAFVAAAILMLSVASCGTRGSHKTVEAQADSTEVVVAVDSLSACTDSVAVDCCSEVSAE